MCPGAAGSASGCFLRGRGRGRRVLRWWGLRFWRKWWRTARPGGGEFLTEPLQAAQVIAQGFFGIGFGPVVDEADGPLLAAVTNDPHHAEFLIALA